MDPVAAAKAFVKEKLGVNIVQDKSADLLKIIVRAFFEKVPYQNVSTSVLPPGDRFPNEIIVVENGTSLKGGMNVHNNWFFKMLLEALGYKVELLSASMKYPPSATPRKFGSHFAILVKDVEKPGDLHLVDVGTSYPLFKPVPLNELPYLASDVNLDYRFVDEDDQWHREHKDSDSETWTRYISYDKISTNENPGEVFRGPLLEFLREDLFVGGITAVHYPQPGSSAIPDVPDFNKDLDYVVRIDNDRITIRNSSGFEWNEWIPQDGTISTFGTYFPNIPKNDVEKKIQILSGEAELIRLCSLVISGGEFNSLQNHVLQNFVAKILVDLSKNERGMIIFRFNLNSKSLNPLSDL